MVKIWPLFVVMGAAAAAAGVTVWAASITGGVSLDFSNSNAENGLLVMAHETALDEEAPEASNERSHTADTPQSSGIGPAVENLPACTATRYARALQQGQTAKVIHMTHWMQERLKRVRLGSDMPEDLELAREELRRDILERTLEGNRLRAEGVEDKYIFAPGARIEKIGADRRENLRHDALALPVKRRTWLRVEYPNPGAALRDEAGRPIKSIVVGVDLSEEGYVLKAGVLGNVEINRDAISLDWDQ